VRAFGAGQIERFFLTRIRFTYSTIAFIGGVSPWISLTAAPRILTSETVGFVAPVETLMLCSASRMLGREHKDGGVPVGF